MQSDFVLILELVFMISSHQSHQIFPWRWLKDAGNAVTRNVVPSTHSNVTVESLTDSARIINGEEKPHNQYPFLVSIEYATGTLDNWASTCGGSIVNRITVLTACHCATRDEKIHGNIKYIADPDTRRVVAGTAYWNSDSPTKQVARVRNIVTHPKCGNFPWIDNSFVNDVSLFFLKDALSYNYEVQPMVLPSMDLPSAINYQQQLLNNGAWCETVGWGRTVMEHQEQSLSLFVAPVQLLNGNECRSRFCLMTHSHCHTDFEGLGQICVASPVASDCYGDSGGPLICNGFVVGTVSYGSTCLPNLPTVHQGLRPIIEVLAINNVSLDEPTQSGGQFPEINYPFSQLVDDPVIKELHEIRSLLERLFNNHRSHRKFE